MSGPMTSSRVGPTMAGSSACSTSLPVDPRRSQPRLDRRHRRPTCSSCAACLATLVLITGQSSSPRHSESGLQLSGTKTAFIEPGSPWENGYCESFTRSFATNSSTARSSTASPRQRSSSKHGGATTTPSGLTHRSDTDHRLRRRLSGLRSQPDRFQQRKQWPKSPSCIKVRTHNQ